MLAVVIGRGDVDYHEVTALKVRERLYVLGEALGE